MDVNMAKISFIRPEPPRAAMARPTISIGDDCAAPQSVEAGSNIVKKARNATALVNMRQTWRSS